MGIEFNELFDEWSNTYDETIAGNDPEYIEVFREYDNILKEVAAKSSGNVYEFGVGTGNLTEKLLEQGKFVFGFEPSDGMRKIAEQKLPNINLVKGDFLNFPLPSEAPETIVSTYAFHHLTDEEKELAIENYSRILLENGKIIFADTLFTDNEAKSAMIRQAENSGFHRLANDLKTEYYTTISVFQRIFESYGFSVSFTRKNDFVWLIEAIKQGRDKNGKTKNNECRKL